ncbi:MAG TPA: hypothetical protein VHE61_01100 [Opitutaceae bacterium]|nr:hypothetical protein [Opitutaceae bacterium]
MKVAHLAALTVIGVSLLLSGCDSLSDATLDMRERFSSHEQEPRSKTFSATPRVTYEAVRAAANNMGYRFVRGGPAQGIFEAVNDVSQGDTAGTARQVSMKVRLHATLDETGTEVSVRFSEILESDSSNQMGMATETTMRDTPLYEVFFRNIQQALGARPTAQPVQPGPGQGK